MTVIVRVGLEVIECAECSTLFGMTEDMQERRRRDHKTFYCPMGHSNYYGAKSDIEKARDEAKAAKDRAARLSAELDQTNASLTATRGVVTRQKRKLQRVTNGVCPECSRSFQDLKRHMKSKHGETRTG